MGKKLDLTGQQFGHWTVESYAGSKRWWCVCVCGTRKTQISTNLTRGNTKSCGCAALHRIDLSGQRFGRWTVLDHIAGSKWRCICECGNEGGVESDNLRGGGSKSCGCDTRSLPGTRYGHWMLLKFLGRDTWDARCDCGTLDTKRESSLKVGRKDASCGCVARSRSAETLALLQKQKPTHSPKLKDLSGLRLGMVEVLHYVGSGKWMCRCDCGVTTPLTVDGLRQGKTRSCGCVRIQGTIERNKRGHERQRDIIGQRFERLVVLSKSTRVSHWCCRCDCGETCEIQYANLTKGQTRSCGCLLRDKNSAFKKYANVAERNATHNDQKRQRRYADPHYAAQVRLNVRLSSMRQRILPEGKMRMAQIGAIRRMRVALGPGVSAQEWLLILEAWEHRCAYCNDSGDLTQDHVLAVSAGGQHAPDNVVPACKRCNSRKNAFPLEIALVRLGCTNFHERRQAATLFLRDIKHA